MCKFCSSADIFIVCWMSGSLWSALVGLSWAGWWQLHPPPPPEEIKLDLAKSSLVTKALECLIGRGGGGGGALGIGEDSKFDKQMNVNTPSTAGARWCSGLNAPRPTTNHSLLAFWHHGEQWKLERSRKNRRYRCGHTPLGSILDDACHQKWVVQPVDH